MRKLFSLLTGAAVIMMSAACTTESESPVIEKGKELATIIASVESSRTTVETEEGLAYYNWQKNEAISVIEEDGTDPSIFTVSDAATGAFTGIKSENKGLSYAVSPAVALESGMDVGGELFEYTIEMPETWENYEPGTTNAIMIGYSTGTDGNGKYLFNFDHAAALVKVTYENVPVGTKYFCFETDQIINGLWEGIDKIQGVELETPASGNKATFLELAEAVAFPNQTMDFYVPVPVGTYHSFSISLLDANLGTIDETARAKDQFEVELHRGELYSTPVITLPETPLYGSYIIVSKAATKGNWVVMQAAVNDKGRWLYDDSGIAYTEDVNLYDSSIDFPAYSNISYRFDVIELEEGGYVLRNAQSGNYVQFVGTASNAGKEVSEDEKAAFDVFKINGDGTWTIGSWYNDTDFYSLQYNVGNYFTFYKSNQAGIYLIPYVGAAAPVQLSGSCSKNTVTLTAIPEEAEIRYTVDESEPTANSILYEGPFGITESCTVKAVAFAPNSDYQDSDVLVLECTYVEPGTAAYYEKVTEAPNDWTGDYLIVYEADEAQVLTGVDSGNVGTHADVEISDDAIEATEDITAYNIEIKAGNTEGTYTMKLGDVYLAYTNTTTSKNNYLYAVSDASTDGAEWYLSVDDAQNAYNTSRYLRYNSGSPRFCCYVSGQQKIAFYKLADSRTPLSTPDGLSVSGMEVSWSPVEGAESYTVTVGSTVASVQGTSYTYEGEAGYYNVSVVAVPASGSAYSSSAPAVLEEVKFGDPKLETPVLKAGVCTNESVSATWDAIDNATEGYTAYIYIKGAQEPLYGGWTVTDCEAIFSQLESGTDYTIAVYANEVVTGNRVYLASDVATLDISTTEGTTTIADVIAGCGENFSVSGVTVVGVASTSNALVGDGTGFALVYLKSHGLAVGDVINISGATIRYNGVTEFVQPAVEKTGTAPAVSYGDPVEATAELLESFTEGDFDITYVQASGTQSGRNITLGNGYVFYMYATNADTNNKPVRVSGLIYGWNGGYNNFNFFFTSIEEDTNAPTLSVSPKVKNWAYNDTSEQEFTIEYTNGTLSIEPETIEWADINYTVTGSGITVQPKNENTTQTKREAILTVTVTPNNSNFEPVSVEISLSQGINSGTQGGTATLTGDDMANMSNAGLGYGTEKSVTVDGFVWETNGYQTSTLKNMIQIRVRTHNSGVSYVKLPDFDSNIKTVTMKVTTASDASYADGSNPTGTYAIQSGTTNDETVVVSGTATNKEVTFDLSNSSIETGYIVSTNGAVRIWEISVEY